MENALINIIIMVKINNNNKLIKSTRVLSKPFGIWLFSASYTNYAWENDMETIQQMEEVLIKKLQTILRGGLVHAEGELNATHYS